MSNSNWLIAGKTRGLYRRRKKLFTRKSRLHMMQQDEG
jgi:hypothetical protein